MTEWRIRPFEAPADYAPALSIYNLFAGEPYTVESWSEEDQHFPADGFLFRCVAEGPMGQLGAVGELFRFPTHLPGRYMLIVIVDTALRSQGLGARMAQELHALAESRGAQSLLTVVRDNEPSSRAWAERRSFKLDRHMFESTLNLAEFDPAPFAGQADLSGLRLASWAEAGTEELKHQFHRLVQQTCKDIPGFDHSEESFADWHAWVFEHSEYRPEGIILALDGEQLVGVTVCRPEGGEGAWYTHYTGVDSAYRGRGLAMALKLASIAVAKAAGAPRMRTNNDSQNGPMLAVNRRLGYQPEAGYWKLVKEL